MADDSPAAPYPTHGPALGAAELRALSHPLRLRILDELSMYGPLTASGLGERLGESSGSTSYHLRQLEKVGLVEETVGKGNARERWWERRAGSITFPDPSDFPAGSADRLAARLLGEEALRGRDQAFREFIAQDDDAIDHAEDALDLTTEIGVARGIDDVETGFLPLHRGAFGENGDAAFTFQVVGIHDAFGNLLIGAERTGLLEKLIDQGCLAVVDMGDDGDVA